MSAPLFFSTDLNYQGQKTPKSYIGFVEGYIKAASDKQLRLILKHDSTHRGPYEKFTFNGAFGHLNLDFFLKSNVKQKIKTELEGRHKDSPQFQSSYEKNQKKESKAYKEGFIRGYATAGSTEELKLLLDDNAQSFTGGFDSLTFREIFADLNLDFFEARDAKKTIKDEIDSRESPVAGNVREKPSFRFGG